MTPMRLLAVTLLVVQVSACRRLEAPHRDGVAYAIQGRWVLLDSRPTPNWDWKLCKEAGACSHLFGPSRPDGQVYLRFHDALELCQWRKLRLPTFEEWRASNHSSRTTHGTFSEWLEDGRSWFSTTGREIEDSHELATARCVFSIP